MDSKPSNIEYIFEERAADIGNFKVGRLLPFRQKRAVGPFVFIDHMGPARLSEQQNLDVPPHPHIGLSTLTYLFEGSILHRDSLGNAVGIEAGEVNWMTAGKGIVHSERTPEHLRKRSKNLHGLQIWVALPRDKEQIEPSFVHFGTKDIPAWEEDGVSYRLIAGALNGVQSPVPVHSPLYFMEIKACGDHGINIGRQLYGEVGMYILEGMIRMEDKQFGKGQFLIAEDASLLEFRTQGEATLYLFGGNPLEEDRHMFWNFVHSDRSILEKAMQNWKDQNLEAFPKIPGDDSEYVPLPGPR